MQGANRLIDPGGVNTGNRKHECNGTEQTLVRQPQVKGVAWLLNKLPATELPISCALFQPRISALA